MKDYYSINERKGYYFERMNNYGLPNKIRASARKRYDELKNVKPKKYQPKHVLTKKDRQLSIKDFIKLLKEKKHRDDDKNKNPSYISNRHKNFDHELDKLNTFRHRNKLSFQDRIIVTKNSFMKKGDTHR